MFEICSDLSKTCLKIYYFCQHSNKAKKAQMAKPFYFWKEFQNRPNGNPAKLCFRYVQVPTY